MTPPPEPKPERHLVLSFQTRLNLTLLAAAIIPLGIFGVLLLVSGAVNPLSSQSQTMSVAANVPLFGSGI